MSGRDETKFERADIAPETDAGLTQEDRALLKTLLLFENGEETAEELLDGIDAVYGGLTPFLDAVGASDRPLEGLSDRTLLLLRAIPTLCRRAMQGGARDRTVRSFEDAREILRPFYVGYAREAAVMLALDADGRVRGVFRLNTGGGNSVELRPEAIIEKALPVSAAKVVLSHSHPGGTSAPSITDYVVTQRLVNSLRDFGIGVADHLVFSRDGCRSMAAGAPRGMIGFTGYGATLPRRN